LELLINCVWVCALFSQKWRSEATTLGKKIEAIEGYKSKLLGEGLGSCSVQELQELEVQLEKSLCSIRQKKQKMLMDQILELREKVRIYMHSGLNLYIYPYYLLITSND
jgi:hypothetical protein